MFEFTETFTVPLPDVEYNLAEFAEADYSEKHGLITEIAAIHEGVTQNFNKYTAAVLSNSLHTWHTPYQKPIIMNHDRMSEPIGRVIGAKMDQEEDGTPYIRIQAAIVDPVAMQKVLDRRYITGSIGGKAEEAVCSICDTDWAHPKEGVRGMPCSHRRGKVYKGKLATMEMRDITFVEYSFVNVPSDKNSGVKAITKAEESDEWNHKAKFFVLDLGQESILECREDVNGGVDILEEMKKKDASPLYHNIKGAFIQAQISNNTETEESANDYIGDTTKDDGINTSSEENDSMADNEKVETAENEDNILDVMNDLEEDLNAPAEDDTSEESDDDTEHQESDETDDTEESDDKSDTEESEQAQEDDTAEDENSDDASDAPEESEEVTTDNETGDAEENDTEEQTDETDSEEQDDDEPIVEQLKSEVASLKEENTKLKTALHRTLAERVVDAKIAAGVIEAEDRGDELTEHAKRTASSLADSLRDLAKLPKVAKSIGEGLTDQIQPKIIAVSEDADSVQTEGEEAVDEDKNPVQVLEDAAVDALMGRRSLQ